jgi:hypothetical protein
MFAQAPAAELPDTPSQVLIASAAAEPVVSSSSIAADPFAYSFLPGAPQSPTQNPNTISVQDEAKQAKDSDRQAAQSGVELDADGNPIPLERQQPKRILGLMPNFRSVSGGGSPSSHLGEQFQDRDAPGPGLLDLCISWADLAHR